jgi:uncharacterized protein YhaN
VKIDRLDLKAFGCFTDVTLDFTAAEHGMYVVYGPNEAGKSTSLKAIRQWLYEFDGRESIDYLHKNAKQRVGGEMVANGKRLYCLRKRGRQGTLLGEDGKTPLPDTALRELLQGVDEPRFRTTFGIDRVQLVAGGREIAAGHGDLGQALFAAGSGLIHLRRIQTGLEAAARQLFAVRGQNPQINVRLTRCAELEQALAKEQLSASDFEAHQRNLRDAEEQRRLLVTQQGDLKRQVDELARLAQARQPAARRSARLDQLRGLEGTVRLRDEFPQDFHDADGKLKAEQESLDEQLAQLKNLGEELEALTDKPTVLAESDRLHELQRRAGACRKAQEDLPKIKVARNTAEGEAKQILRRLGRDPDLDDERIEPLRLDDQTRDRVRTLGNSGGQRRESAESAQREASKDAVDLAALEADLAALPPPPDVSGLAVVVQRVVRLGPIEDVRTAASRRLADAERALAQGLKRLLLWTGHADRILQLPVPASEDVDAQRETIDAAQQRRTAALGKVQDLRSSITALEEKLERIRGGGAVPSEDELEEARARRERGWRLVRGAWLDGHADDPAANAFVTEAPPARDLAAAYETAVAHTDDIADRLRREAGRVSEQAAARAELTAASTRLTAAEAELADAEAEVAAANAAWNALWQPAGITPRTPVEMRRWLDDWRRLVQAAETRQQRADEWADARANVETATAEVRAALEASGGVPASFGSTSTLDDRLQLAQNRLADADARRQHTEGLIANIVKQRRKRDTSGNAAKRAAEQWQQWQREWGEAVAFLELGPDAQPDQVNRVLDTVLEFWRKTGEVKERRKRVEGMEQEIAEFDRDVRALASRLDSAATVADSSTALDRLLDDLRSAEFEAQSRKEKQAAYDDLAKRVAERRRAIATLTAKCERLQQEANVPNADAVPAAIRRSTERKAAEQEIAGCESTLRSLAGLVPLDEFCRRAVEAAGRNLDAEGAQLDQQVQACDEQVRNLSEAIGKLRTGLEEMQARSGAGDAAARLESERAALRGLVDEYAGLVLAGKVLEEAIRRYRDRNKAGILDEASRLFDQLTGGSFQRLDIGEDDHGQPVLVGVRRDGAPLGVGAMSDGTCDQLYLALRLAHLRRHVATHGPFPFIVDDILVNFDDVRARAALRCLAALGVLTQVIFFTHHAHLRAMAADAEFGGKIFVQDLPECVISGDAAVITVGDDTPPRDEQRKQLAPERAQGGS